MHIKYDWAYFACNVHKCGWYIKLAERIYKMPALERRYHIIMKWLSAHFSFIVGAYKLWRCNGHCYHCRSTWNNFEASSVCIMDINKTLNLELVFMMWAEHPMSRKQWIFTVILRFQRVINRTRMTWNQGELLQLIVYRPWTLQTRSRTRPSQELHHSDGN